MPKAIVIGGGIIGLSSAYFLQKEGWEVTVIEKGDLSDNCSFGNMGYLSPSHVIPLAAPGMIEQGIFWMFNQKSPFYVRPIPSLEMLDWGLKFIKNSTKRHVERSMKPGAELMLLSKKLFFDWQNSGEMEFELEEKGCIMWYQTEKKGKAEIETAREAERLGMKIELLDSEQAKALEPETRPEVLGGVWYKDDAHLYPNRLMQQLPKLLESRGVKVLKNTEVVGFQSVGNEITGIEIRGANQKIELWESEMVVLAAGSWSPKLAKLIGVKVPLMPGKGYSTTYENPTVKLNVPCIFLEAKVALTPWKNRLRIGSTMEIGPINDRILFPRVQGIIEGVQRFMPGFMDDPKFRELADFQQLKTNLREKVWFGFRPVSADGMPIIGFSKKHKNLILATGHAMLGLSMGTGTGKLVAELASGKETSIAVGAFSPGRF